MTETVKISLSSTKITALKDFEHYQSYAENQVIPYTDFLGNVDEVKQLIRLGFIQVEGETSVIDVEGNVVKTTAVIGADDISNTV